MYNFLNIPEKINKNNFNNLEFIFNVLFNKLGKIYTKIIFSLCSFFIIKILQYIFAMDAIHFERENLLKVI